MNSANPAWTPSDDEDDAYTESKSRRSKRRKTNTGKAAAVTKHRATRTLTSLSELEGIFRCGLIIRTATETETSTASETRLEDDYRSQNIGFESAIEGLLSEFLRARQVFRSQSSDTTLPGDNKGAGGKEDESELLRPLSRFETARIVAFAKQHVTRRAVFPSEWVVLRKLQLYQERRRAGIRVSPSLGVGTPASLTPLDPPSTEPVQHAVLDILRSIYTTQYECSFAARVYGCIPQKTPGLIAVDWESHAPWTLLMDDIQAHYTLAHPERDRTERPRTPITYVSLQPLHLRQVHELLARVFWDGIDVSDALRYAPERCTVVAMYGRLVVGAALLSSPQETYITYLAVRAGWENAQIATTMLYHLILLHPHRDITLHVSANNPAMLLYNRFGFKAEEFIAGFYEAYLDAHSRVSKNAFRLRLRR